MTYGKKRRIPSQRRSSESAAKERGRTAAIPEAHAPWPFPSHPENPAPENLRSTASRERELFPKNRGLFQSRDGTSLYYEVYGEGRPLLLCYGLLCRREHWRHQLQYFAKRYQVILFDYRGHQYSGRPANDRHMTLQWCGSDIQDLLNHLSLTEVVAFGHSMGVGVLTHAAVLEKSRVRGLVFICGTVTNPFQNMFHSNRMNRVHQFTSVLYDLMPGFVSKAWARLTEKNRLNFFLTSRLGFNADTAQAQDVHNYMEGVNQTPYPVFHALIDDYTHFDGREFLKKIGAPSLVIAGGKDVITPMALQEEMTALLAKGVLHQIPDGSHNAHMDFPNEVNTAIDAFLEKINYR